MTDAEFVRQLLEERDRLRAELEEARVVICTLVTLFPDLPELLGGRHRQPAFELMVDANRVVENNGVNQ